MNVVLTTTGTEQRPRRTLLSWGFEGTCVLCVK